MFFIHLFTLNLDVTNKIYLKFQIYTEYKLMHQFWTSYSKN